MLKNQLKNVSVNELIKIIGSHRHKVISDIRNKYPNIKIKNRQIGCSWVWYEKQNIHGCYFRFSSLCNLLQRVKNAYIIISQDYGIWVTTSEKDCVKTLTELENLGAEQPQLLPNNLNDLIQIVGSKYFGIYKMCEV